MSFVRIWYLFAPIDFSNITFSLDTLKNPFNKFIVVITTQIKIPIVTIAFVPIPTQIIMRGPSAIFGKEFRITK